jgi:hypothetical protein
MLTVGRSTVPYRRFLHARYLPISQVVDYGVARIASIASSTDTTLTACGCQDRLGMARWCNQYVRVTVTVSV